MKRPVIGDDNIVVPIARGYYGYGYPYYGYGYRPYGYWIWLSAIWLKPNQRTHDIDNVKLDAAAL